MFAFILGFLACLVIAIAWPTLFVAIKAKAIEWGKRILDALSKAPPAAMLALAIVLPLMLTACAAAPSGVTFADGEMEGCARSQDCTVWSAEQLQRLIQFVWNKATEAAMKGGV